MEEQPHQGWTLGVSERFAPAVRGFLNPRLGAAAELPERQAAQARLTVLLAMTIQIVLMLSVPLWWWVAELPVVAAGCMGCSLLLLGVEPLLRRFGRPKSAALWLLMCCYLLEGFAVSISGGIESPFLLFLAIPPLYAALIYDGRFAMLLGLGSLPVVALLAWLGPAVPSLVTISASSFNAVAVVPFAMVIAMVGCVAVTLEARAIQRLEASREEERRQRELAEQAAADRARFFSRISHDLRTPLNAIVGSAELMTRELPEFGLQREHGERLMQNSQHLLRLVDDLLQLRETQGQPPAPQDELPSLSVLVVDDIDTNRIIARYMLQALGVEVREAGSGQEALDAIRADRPDLVLLDRHMPGVDGLEVARQVRQRDQALPLIGVSASVLPEDREACLEAGMDLFLPKPLRMDVLRKLLSDVGERQAS